MTNKVDFTGLKWGSVQWTMLCTLYLRAHEARSEHSVLGDHAAAEAVDRIEYDFSKMRKYFLPATSQFLVSLRAKQFDEWTVDFLERCPDAVVLHLGCGLDSRAFRLDLPAGVDWFDVDVPGVIELRRQVYAERDRYQMIGSSVTDTDWLEGIPTGRPVLVVAEGLLPYLTESEIRELLRRLTDRFDTGELLFDGVPRWAALTSPLFKWGTRDGRELERWNPRLKHVEDLSSISQYRRIPAEKARFLFRLCHAIPVLRDYDRLFRFRF